MKRAGSAIAGLFIAVLAVRAPQWMTSGLLLEPSAQAMEDWAYSLESSAA
jgi:hypothetical protein